MGGSEGKSFGKLAGKLVGVKYTVSSEGVLEKHFIINVIGKLALS